MPNFSEPYFDGLLDDPRDGFARAAEIHPHYRAEAMTPPTARSELQFDPRENVFATNLTAREAEVMDLLLTGKTPKQIAAELGISVQTAAKHRAKVLDKHGVANDVELLRRMLSLDILNM